MIRKVLIASVAVTMGVALPVYAQQPKAIPKAAPAQAPRPAATPTQAAKPKTAAATNTQRQLAVAKAAYENADYETAVGLWKPLADRGVAEAQLGLGILYEDGDGVSQDDGIALSWYSKAANQGLAEAQYWLGIAYLEGYIVFQDDDAALGWFRRAADGGLAGAQNRLGDLYSHGEIVMQDDVAAVSWYRKAADKGYAEGQLNLGDMYWNGFGVPQDISIAISWYVKAAAKGQFRAQDTLKSIAVDNTRRELIAKAQLSEGLAAYDSKDYLTALSLLRPLADQGDADAQARLGLAYYQGHGVPVDYVLSYMWLNLAAAKGARGAATARTTVAAKMTSAQIADAQAQRLATAGRPSSSEAVGVGGAPTIRLEAYGGTYVVPVVINGAITLKFIVDSGAADVTIPQDVFSTLVRAGTISARDMQGTETYTTADGRTHTSPTFIIRSLKVGGIELSNIKGSVAEPEAPLLLGQSFLQRFSSWSMDNAAHQLLLGPIR